MTQTVIIKEKIQLTDDIYQFTFVNQANEPLAAYEAGAHIDLLLGPDVSRQYSLFNPYGNGKEYKIAIKKEINGRGGSKHVCETYEVGDTAWVSEPRNLFALETEAKHYILLGGGIGITPIIALAEQLLSINGVTCELHYFARSKADAAFREYLSQERFEDIVFFHYDDGPDEQKMNFTMTFAKPWQHTQVYMCGPQGFMQAVEEACKNWSPGTVKKEHFGASEAIQQPKQAFDVRLAKSGLEFQVGADESLADALKKHGKPVRISCSEGVCGECLCKVVSGDIDHRDTVLGEFEKQAGNIMAPCVSRGQSDSTLVLDL